MLESFTLEIKDPMLRDRYLEKRAPEITKISLNVYYTVVATYASIILLSIKNC